jgi:hypothetical protein
MWHSLAYDRGFLKHGGRYPALIRSEVWRPGRDLVVLRAAAFVIGYWRMVICYFADSRGFALGGPDQCARNMTNDQCFMFPLILDTKLRYPLIRVDSEQAEVLLIVR